MKGKKNEEFNEIRSTEKDEKLRRRERINEIIKIEFQQKKI